VKAFQLLDDWPCAAVAAAAIGPDGAVSLFGDADRVFELASVTKLLTAATIHLGVEEGSISLDDELDERGATIADVLSHAGGLAPNGVALDEPGRRRIYSNGGYELVASSLEAATEMAVNDYMHEGLFVPLGMHATTLSGSPAHGAQSTVRDLVRFITRLSSLLAPQTLELMVRPYLPELIGVLPGYGRQTPNPWGLGPEIRGDKSPHWTGVANSRFTWGHFGQSGTFLWVDPEVDVAVVVLTDQPFGDWAVPLWPAFSDAVRMELTS
jgi:CubicO group peptidase (beta-lactamase class C family)